MIEKCKVCGYNTVNPNGIQNAPWLIVGDKPSYDDMKAGLPFTGEIEQLLTYELARVGIQLQRCRLITAWPHEATKDMECLNQYFGRVLKELLIPRSGVLFVGDSLTGMFGVQPVKDISGLVMDTIPTVGLTGRFVFIESLFGFKRGTIGELRFALRNLRGEL